MLGSFVQQGIVFSVVHNSSQQGSKYCYTKIATIMPGEKRGQGKGGREGGRECMRGRGRGRGRGKELSLETVTIK